MATSSSSLYLIQQQQLSGDQAQQNNANPVAAEPSYSSGSIGPFFAIISVLIVLAVLSCFLGRICTRGKLVTAAAADGPLEIIKGRGWRGWLRRKWRQCLAGDVEAGAKVADCNVRGGPKDGEGHEQVPQP